MPYLFKNNGSDSKLMVFDVALPLALNCIISLRPLLLNFRSLTDTGDRTETHPDEGQLGLDLPRTSLPRSLEYRRDPQATKKRQEQLGKVVTNVLRSYPWLRYYQGFHELALTFLSVFGSERPATEASKMAALFFVRDAMSSNLDHVLQQLQLLYALLKATSPEIYEMLMELEVPPFFAISWVLTWFAHDLDDFSDICRIFDFLIVSPPMQVVYMVASIVQKNRDEVLGLERDFAVVHSGLTKLAGKVRNWVEIIEESYCLQIKYPATMLQHMGDSHLNKLSAVTTYEATWSRLDPARPLPFSSLVVTKNGHPLSSKNKSDAGTKGERGNRMGQVIDLTDTAQKARQLAAQHRWPLLVATVASATFLMYAWMLMQQLQLQP
ncbi:GTPase-activating protein gyp8 [Dipsacomyces acuminosporus]|nr:GTPase-activating protein gyp8 [Dipsacomyces acuminosporus]